MRPSPRPRPAARFDQLHKWIDTHQDQAIVVGALVIGAWLLGNSLYVIVSLS